MSTVPCFAAVHSTRVNLQHRDIIGGSVGGDARNGADEQENKIVVPACMVAVSRES